MSQWDAENPELVGTPYDPMWRPPVEPALPVDHDEDQDADLSSKQHWNSVRSEET